MVKLMVYFLLRPAEAGGEERPADLPGSSDKEGELRCSISFLVSDYFFPSETEPEPISFSF
jgi:hypothetical protein